MAGVRVWRWMAAGIAVACTLAAAPAGAQNATVTLSASSTRVAVGERFQLQIRAEVQGGRADDVTLPDLGAFRVVGHHVSRPMQLRLGFGRGQRMIQASIVHRYTLEAVHSGRFEIEPAEVRIDGRTYRSDPLTIVVSDSGGTAPGGTPRTRIPGPPPDPSDDIGRTRDGGPGPDGADAADFDRQAFLRTVVDDTKPWVGEQVTVSVYLYSRKRVRSSPVVVREPATDGFWKHDLLAASRNLHAERQVVRNRAFNVYLLRRFALFPLRSGELTIGAMKLKIRSGSLFDMFRSRGNEPLARSGVPVTVEAKALPDPGRRDVVVGRYELNTNLAQQELSTSEATTFKAVVEGKGNLRQVQLELPDVPGVRILRPRTEDSIEAEGDVVGGKRVFEWLVVPQQPGTHRIPGLALTYFDPEAERYATAEAAPVTLRATGRPVSDAGPRGSVQRNAPDGGPPSGAAGPAAATGRTRLGPIRTESTLQRRNAAPWSEPWYPLALAMPPLAWVGFLAAGPARRRWTVRRGGSRHAARLANRRLVTARKHASERQPRAFYAEVAQALKMLLEARLGEPIGGMTYPELRHHLLARGMTSELADRLIDELEGGDFARFSASGVSLDEMQRCLERAHSLVTELSRFAPEPTEART